MEILAQMAQAKQTEYIIALLGLFGYIAFWRVLNGPVKAMQPVSETLRAFTARLAGFLVPDDLLFHPGHAWARVGAGDVVTIGMDDFAAKLLGSVDSMTLPKEGSRLKQGSLGWSLKADSRVVHMLSPVEGEVLAVNREAVDSPATALADPYGKGWLLKVKGTNLLPNMKNMVPAGMIGKWFETIRENLISRQLGPQAAMMYQDGGEPVAGIARVIDPQNWDDLAREFFLTK